jgi:hypothetical protein
MQEEAEEADPPTYRLPNGIGGFQVPRNRRETFISNPFAWTGITPLFIV